MAVLRLSGHHEFTAGRPQVFRTSKGTSLRMLGRGVAGLPGGGSGISPIFSRKDETANLDAVRAQHSQAAHEFDAHEHTSLHVTNNVPYIMRLNEGWSAQTEPGFFERALQIAVNAIRGSWKISEMT